MYENFNENPVNEEFEKSVQKIKKVFSYGVQQSSCVFIPEDKVHSMSYQTSFEPFYVNEKAREAEETFLETLDNIMSQSQLPQHLYKILEDQKLETALILEQYDSIISELSKSLVEYDKEYRQKCEKHTVQHEHLQENIEDLISEINRIGKEEIQNIRMSIIRNTKNESDKYWEKCRNMLDESNADVPFDDYVWTPPTTMLSFEELVETFSIPQKEVIVKRRDMLSKICELRKNLEREKLEHALKLERLERELFEIQEDYKRKKLSFANLKRKQNSLISKRDKLRNELKEIFKNIEKECEIQKKHFEKHQESKKVKRYLLQEDNLKYDYILKERCIEAYNLLGDILNTAKFIMENILGVVINPINLDGFGLNYKNTISKYLCKKSYWYEFINAAPNDCFISGVKEVMEDNCSQLKTHTDLLNKMKALSLENQELQNFLKNYHSFTELSITA